MSATQHTGTRLAARIAVHIEERPAADSARAKCVVPQPTMTAQIMTWVSNHWVDDKTLYILQVYETQRDGDALILL